MARPQKRGIDYFSVDVTIFGDRKIRRIKAACGAESIAVIFRLLCYVYAEKGYYIEASDGLCFDVADEIGVEESLVKNVLECCVNCGFFNKRMFEQYGIYTSRRIQQNYTNATKRRDGCEINPIYVCKEEDSVCINQDIADTNAENVCKGTQSKVKESKVNKNKRESTPTPDKLPFADNVHMTRDEHGKLIAQYGDDAVKWMIAKLDNHKGAKGATYKSDYRAILSWVVDAWMEFRAKQGHASQPSQTPTGKYSPSI